MRAAILGAGIGRRLERPELPPKILLRFGGESLLARHTRILRSCGLTRIDLAVGYRAEAVEQPAGYVPRHSGIGVRRDMGGRDDAGIAETGRLARLDRVDQRDIEASFAQVESATRSHRASTDHGDVAGLRLS